LEAFREFTKGFFLQHKQKKKFLFFISELSKFIFTFVRYVKAKSIYIIIVTTLLNK